MIDSDLFFAMPAIAPALLMAWRAAGMLVRSVADRETAPAR